MGELPEELQPERLATYPLDLVGAEVVQAVLGLDRQSAPRAGLWRLRRASSTDS